MTAKRGRPRDPRTVRFMVRLSEDEREDLQAVADEDGLDLGTWMRTEALRSARKRARALKGKE